MALRRGKIFENMKQTEQQRVSSLIDKFCKQEEAMEEMARERRQLQAVRDELVAKYNVSRDLDDHPFLVKFAEAMPLVTTEFAETGHGPAAIKLITEKHPMRMRNGEKVMRNAKLTWKSYVLQDLEARCREAMKRASTVRCTEGILGYGSEEHDGIRVLITSGFRDPSVVEATMSAAIEAKLGFGMPIEVKPPTPIVFDDTHLEPVHFIKPCDISWYDIV